MQKLKTFIEAGHAGRLQWRGYWKPKEATNITPENAWYTVYRHEAERMLQYHGLDSFRIKPQSKKGAV